jgi:serine/threonine protein kinase
MMMPVQEPKSTSLGGHRHRKLPRRGRWRVMLGPAMGESLHAGQVILGRFRLERHLGQGGMGTVWEARHLSLETQIAIKFLNADLSRREDVLARFALEATSAARIRSPHVVSILDSGFTEEGRGFIAMELLRGEDLSRRLARVHKLSVAETSQLVTQVSRGLAKAHSVGVVHRDLKPENIFVIDEDDVFAIKILDFGIAKSIGSETATHKTDTGQLLGTPLYMSPEQALGHKLDSRSDLYSLAVLAYRCLTGRPPFLSSAVGELIVAVSTHEPPPPSRFNPALPAALDQWFEGALAKEPSARICQTAAEVAESFKLACRSALGAHQPSSGRMRVAAVTPSVPPPTRTDTEESPVPSAEEVATTISAPQLAVGWRASITPIKRLPKWRVRALLAGVAGSAALAGLGFRYRSGAPESAVEASLSNGVHPAPTIEINAEHPPSDPQVYAVPAASSEAKPPEPVPSSLQSVRHVAKRSGSETRAVSDQSTRTPTADAGSGGAASSGGSPAAGGAAAVSQAASGGALGRETPSPHASGLPIDRSPL